MKKRLLLLLILIAFYKANSQSLDIVKSYASTGTIIGYDIVTSSNGNVLIAGEFNGTVDFDPGAGVSSVNGGSSSGWATYLSCFDSTGNFLWVKTWNFNLTFTDKAYINLALKNNDEIVLAGYFKGIADFNPDAASFQLNANNGKCFLLSLSSSGNFIDAKNLGSGGDVRAQDLTIGENNSILLTGYFLDFTTDFDPSASSSNLGCAGLVDAFILKLDSALNFTWVKSIGGTNSEYPERIGIDKFNNVILTGYFTSSSLNLDPNGSVGGNVTNSGLRDGFICKLDATGNYLWSGKIGGTANDRITGLAVDTLGDIWIGGYFEGTSDLDPGIGIQNNTAINSTNSDIFFSKISAAGALQFVKQIGSDGTEELQAIEIDKNNRLWLLGSANDTIDFDPGSNVFDYGRILGSFLTTYDSNGDLLFVRDAYTFAYNLAIDNSNHVFTNIITSNFSNFNFYTTAGITTTNYTNTTGNYNCLLRYSECTTQSVASITLNPATITACDGDTVLITAIPTNGGNYPSYIWLNFNSPIANQNSSVLNQIVSPTFTNISCKIISSNGCVDRYPSMAIGTINNVNAYVTPTSFINPGLNSICLGSAITLTSSFTNGGNAPTFEWFKNGTAIPNATDSTYITTNYAALDVFSCIFVSNATCATLDTISTNYTIYPATTPSLITYTAGPTIYTVTDPGVSYQWYTCTTGFTPILGAVSSTYTATSTGNYAVVVSNGSCTDTSTCYFINTVGTNDLSTNYPDINLRPNPFENNLEIKLSQVQTDAIIQVTDIAGRVMYQSVSDAERISINTSDWSSGIYFLRLNEQSFKLVKQ